VPLDIDGLTVLDGRHRLRAARELGLRTVPVRPVRLHGEDPTAWLVKAALLRRHLSDDQRAMMAALYSRQHSHRKAGPGRGRKTSSHAGSGVSHPARAEAATRMNVAPKRIDRATAILRAAPTLAEQVHRGEVKLAQAARQVRQVAARREARQLPPPDGLFDVIVIDPPWRYDRQPTDYGLRGEVDYATLSIDELKALRLPAAADCVLWLWTTNAFMREAFELLESWGFTPKTILTWDKVHMGLGDWLRNRTEHCRAPNRVGPWVARGARLKCS
jgi:hypothetical protein